MLMLGKELLSGLWVRPECRSFCCHFHTRPCLTLLFHRSLFSHHFRCDPALSVFASKCQGECHAWTAALCDLGDPGWGDPWFRHWALLLLSPTYVALWCGLCLFCVVSFFGPFSEWHIRCHHACNSHCWLRSHCSLSFLFGFCFGCVFLLFLLCCFWFAFLSFLSLGQFLDCVLVHNRHFCGFRQSDSPACKLQFTCLSRLNVCNDLAEAMKALDGKKELNLCKL